MDTDVPMDITTESEPTEINSGSDKEVVEDACSSIKEQVENSILEKNETDEEKDSVKEHESKEKDVTVEEKAKDCASDSEDIVIVPVEQPKKEIEMVDLEDEPTEETAEPEKKACGDTGEPEIATETKKPPEEKEQETVEVPTEDTEKKDTKKEETLTSNATEKDTNDGKNENRDKTASTKKDKKKSKYCAECGKKGKKFRLHYQGQNHNLCSEECYEAFKTKLSSVKAETPPPPPINDGKPENCAQCQKETKSGYYPTVGEPKTLCSTKCMKEYQDAKAPLPSCSQCRKQISDASKQLLWETMSFCGEECLGKYQSFLGSHCTCCQQPVQQTSLGKYCVCFGADIRQFCSGSCLEEFKKGLKVCSFCQTDLSNGSTDGFLAQVGDKGQFKDFCSPKCMERYEFINNISNKEKSTESSDCANCNKSGTHIVRLTLKKKNYSLCCDLCVSAFRHSHKIMDNLCETCYNFFKPVKDQTISFKMDNLNRHFCSKPCSTIYVLTHRKITQCMQCKVKKYNTDMIEKCDANNMFCSLNCLSLFRVNVSASSGSSVRCDQCVASKPAQYHLTMSDGSIRNFCSYNCVMLFQGQFQSVPALTNTVSSRQAATTATVSIKPGIKTTSAVTSPVIANVVSLAGPSLPNPIIVQSRGPTAIATKPMLQQSVGVGRGIPGREVIVRPPAPKSLKNKTVSCKPIMLTKGVSARMQTCHKAVQTDDGPTPIFLPIPIPIYVPTPMHMFSRPVPCPVPFPIPIPVPLLVPKDLQRIKEIRDNVANEAGSSKVAELSKSRTQNEFGNSSNDTPPKLSKAAENHGNSHGKKISNMPRIKEEVISEHSENERDYSGEDYVVKEKGKRLFSSQSEHNDLKKPKLDAQLHFRETYNEDPEKNLTSAWGLSSWQRWVESKNFQLSHEANVKGHRFKPHKVDLLAQSSLDLNNSLAVYIKELRRKDGREYTAAALYYFALSIQLFLIENGRPEDIFLDAQFSKFSQSLHEKFIEREKEAKLEGVPLRPLSTRHLWKARQLGVWTPHSLLQTLALEFRKAFHLRTLDEHCNLHFSHIKRRLRHPGSANVPLVYLEYTPPLSSATDPKHILDVDSNNSLCPVKMYEFYYSMCPLAKNGPLYLTPLEERPEDSDEWFTQEPLGRDVIAKILQRFTILKEI